MAGNPADRNVTGDGGDPSAYSVVLRCDAIVRASIIKNVDNSQSLILPRSLRASPFALLLLMGVTVCPGSLSLAQAPKPRAAATSGYAVFSKVETSAAATGIDLTVVCTKAVAPEFTRLKDPERLVIDLPDTLVGTHPPSIDINGADVRAMRINQFRKSPPITRIVLDLVGERDYTFEPDGTSFIVHLRGVQAAKSQAPSQPTDGTYGLGLPGGAAVVPAATHASPGSAITAGADTAVVRLERGGEVRVCPGTTVSVTPSSNGRAVMLGMSEGAVELHYSLASSADTVLTPDFRILLPGPGEFHFAISADQKGNTCIRALQGNTASAIVSELMGDGTYQVKPVEQVVFHGGRLTHIDANVPLECGCPPPRQPQLLAAVPAEAGSMQAVVAPADKVVPPPPPVETAELRPNSPVMAQVLAADPPAAKPAADSPAKAPPAQVIVDAPFVFRASDAPPDVSREVAKLSEAHNPNPLPLPAVPPGKVKKVRKEKAPAVSKGQAKKEKQTDTAKAQASIQPKPSPPPAANPAKPSTFLGKVKGFLRSIFR
jgi:AMIN domain